MIANLRDQSGQALIEMALVLPVLLVLILGVVSYGLYINAVDTVQQSARLAVRVASIGDTLGCPGDSAAAQLASGSNPTVYGVVDDQISANRWLAGDKTNTPIAWAGIIGTQADSQQNNVMITVALAYHPVVPIPGLLPSTIEISQTYEMMVQNGQPVGGTVSTMPSGTPYDETSQWTSPTPPSQGVAYLTQPGGC